MHLHSAPERAETSGVSHIRARLPGRSDVPLDRLALQAIVECPPPWAPVDAERDDYYRLLVERHGPALLEQARQRSASPAWLLVRYLADVPADLVEWSLVAYRRECAEFAELVGTRPELSAADAWEAQRKGRHSRRRRRSA